MILLTGIMRRSVAIGLGAVLLLSAGARIWAQEAITQEEPAPASVHDVITPMSRSFVEQPARMGLFPWLQEQLHNTPPFFRDTTLAINLRTYYLYRHKFDDTISEAWALGGALAYRSGWLLEHVEIGTVLYTSQPLYASEDRDGTGLLKPGQAGYTVLGQLYGRVRLFEAHALTLYRYTYNTPYLNKDDGRMTPNTFEGYTFQGALFSSGHFSFGAINYYADDMINIVYSEARYTWPVTQRLGVLLTVQFTDQRGVGDDLLTGASFDTRQLGVKADLSYAGAILSLAYTANTEGDNLRHPWSSYPGYTVAQVTSFNQAGEHAFSTRLSYDFTELGLTGVTASVLFVHGWGRVEPSTRAPVPNDNEFNVDLQWRPRWRFLKGFWLRTRYGVVHQYEGSDKYLHDCRIIVNYDVPLLSSRGKGA